MITRMEVVEVVTDALRDISFTGTLSNGDCVVITPESSEAHELISSLDAKGYEIVRKS